MTCPHLSLHPSHKYPYCVPGTADKLVNKTDREPCPPGADAVGEVNTRWLKEVTHFLPAFFFFFWPPTPTLPISPRAGNQVYPTSLTGITKPFSLHVIDTVQVQPNSPWNATLSSRLFLFSASTAQKLRPVCEVLLPKCSPGAINPEAVEGTGRRPLRPAASGTRARHSPRSRPRTGTSSSPAGSCSATAPRS